jgi:hypothetical protein
MKINLFPQDIIGNCNLHGKVDANGNVFCKVRHGMYGLPQTGIIAKMLQRQQPKTHKLESLKGCARYPKVPILGI